MILSTTGFRKEAGSMTDREIYISFNEHLQTEEWDMRKYRIGYFMMECCQNYYDGIDSIWKSVADIQEYDVSYFERYPFSEDNREGCIQDFEYYGDPFRAAQTLNDGMKKYYPDIDYCYQCKENGGDAYYYEIYRCINGVLTHQSIRDTAEDEIIW